MTRKRSSEICRRKFGFEGPSNLFLKRASKSLFRLCPYYRLKWATVTPWVKDLILRALYRYCSPQSPVLKY